MKSRITKFATAAVIIAIVVSFHRFIWSIDIASTAWGEITTHIDCVDSVHFYELKFRNYRVNSSMEGWFADGKLVGNKDNGTMFLDDGKTETVFDKDWVQIRQGPSELEKIKGLTFFEKITQGLMQFRNKDILKQVPLYVGNDFLIYRFDPPEKMKEWVQKVSITVGQNSLLPVQMKIIRKDQENAYDLYIFDYEEPEKPVEFFDTINVRKSPQGKAEIMPSGKEVIIDISDSPGIEAVAVRLYNKSFEGIGEKKVMDMAVITTEGFRRGICRQIPLELNKTSLFSVGDSEYWPDKKFRCVTVQIILRPTEKREVYLIEVLNLKMED